MIQTEIIESICDKIVQLDPTIRFAGIIDHEGKMLAQNQNNKLNAILSIQDLEVLFTDIALGNRMERDYDKYFGKENFAISYGGKITSIVFPLYNGIVCVFISKEADTVKTAFLISNMLSKV